MVEIPLKRDKLPKCFGDYNHNRSWSCRECKKEWLCVEETLMTLPKGSFIHADSAGRCDSCGRPRQKGESPIRVLKLIKEGAVISICPGCLMMIEHEFFKGKP